MIYEFTDDVKVHPTNEFDKKRKDTLLARSFVSR